ncbi:MAG: hypothetical protein CL885_02825 [Dehalococcoidia bacterium]|nr:hypothetical protein [Dehalococcoidia bacterium]
MANSGILWIDWLFDLAVWSLYAVADILEVTYEEVNVWLFVILWPLQTILLFAIIVRLRRRLKICNSQSSPRLAEKS